MKVKQVLVSHPGKQHVHRLCIGLQKSGRLGLFITSIWYKPQLIYFRLFKLLPNFIENKIGHILRKRYHPQLKEEKIILHPWYELLRQMGILMFKSTGEKWVYLVERLHDRYVASKLPELPVDVVIGYEKSSYKTFKKAKQLGKTTVLDLAQVHFSHIVELRNQYPIFRSLMPDSFFQKINLIKSIEYLYTDYVITLSSYAKQTLVEAHIPEEKIFTVNLGIDPDKFKPKRNYRSSGTFKILFVGTITRRKGIHLILEAFKQLQLPEAKLEIIGPVDDGSDILNNYKGTYDYYPYMHHEELANKYQDADIFVFPSYLDSWAMTVVEAMACGTPVIVSEHTGAKDLVAQGGGYIIPVNDLEALKLKIYSLYTHREKVAVLGKEASQIAASYTWERYYEQINHIINTITSNNVLCSRQSLEYEEY